MCAFFLEATCFFYASLSWMLDVPVFILQSWHEQNLKLLFFSSLFEVRLLQCAHANVLHEKHPRNYTKFYIFRIKYRLDINPDKPTPLCTDGFFCFLDLKQRLLLTLDCGRCSGVASGAFGVSSVSAFSVSAWVGGAGTLSWAGTQGRQGRQGGRHTLVVIHPDESIQGETK